MWAGPRGLGLLWAGPLGLGVDEAGPPGLRAGAGSHALTLRALHSTITVSRTSASAAAVSATGMRMSVMPKTPQTPSGETCCSLLIPLSGAQPEGEEAWFHRPYTGPLPLVFPWPQFPRLHSEVEGQGLVSSLGLCPAAHRGGALPGPVTQLPLWGAGSSPTFLEDTDYTLPAAPP